MIVNKIFLSVLTTTALFALPNYAAQEKLNAEQVKKELDAMFNVPIFKFNKERDLESGEKIIKQSWTGQSKILRKDSYQFKRVFKLKDQLIGVIVYDKFGYISLVAVDKQFQRMGIGKKLLNYAKEHVSVMGAQTMLLHSTLSALSFYQKYGFIDKCHGLELTLS